jgi:hypothetical protein
MYGPGVAQKSLPNSPSRISVALIDDRGVLQLNRSIWQQRWKKTYRADL